MSILIVADTGPIVILAKLDHLHILAKLYAEIHIPETVLREATYLTHRVDAQRIKRFIGGQIKVVSDLTEDDPAYLNRGLDAGETQAISLAKQAHCPVLMDEKRGRSVAKSEKVDVLGTVGLLLKAKQAQLIPAISPLLDKMLENDYRLSPNLIERAKYLAEETVPSAIKNSASIKLPIN